jgi:hypothetical protein
MICPNCGKEMEFEKGFLSEPDGWSCGGYLGSQNPKGGCGKWIQTACNLHSPFCECDTCVNDFGGREEYEKRINKLQIPRGSY